MTTAIDLATKILSVEEGYSGRIYRDTEGYLTVGYGLKVSDKDAEEFDFPEMPRDVAYVWLQHLVREVARDIEDITEGHSPLRQAVMISMAYQLGVSGLRGFTMTLNSFRVQAYLNTATHMLDSLWARQTPRRAERHAKMMETNELCHYYLI